jgi:hypothetical protein
MVNLLEVLYAFAIGSALAAIGLLLKGRRSAAIWCAWATFVFGLCAALLYVQLSPKRIATDPAPEVQSGK